MKILLILAHQGTQKGFLDRLVYTRMYPPLTLEQLAAITPDRHTVELIDERWQDVNFDWEGDLVGISCLTYSANHAYMIVDEFRKRGKTVVLGGYHPSSLPVEAKQHANSVVIGEAEVSWPRLLNDFEKEKLKPFYRSKPIDPRLIPHPKRITQNYIATTSLQATRGCPYGCTFCAIHKVEGAQFRKRPIENVIREIKSIKSKRLFFADGSLTVDKEYTKALFKEMKGLNKKFTCYGNINTLSKDDELLSLANDAGCELWLVGFESLNQNAIKGIGKYTTNKVKEYNLGIRKIQDHGMMIMGLFIFGFDTDTLDVFDTTLKAIYDMGLNKAGFAVLTPFPGTKLFVQLQQEKRILTQDWTKYTLKDVVFQPKKMSKEELLENTVRLVREYYSTSNVLKRNLRVTNPNFSRLTGDFLTKEIYKISGG